MLNGINPGIGDLNNCSTHEVLHKDFEVHSEDPNNYAPSIPSQA
jgi:hypothetical protein